MPNIPPDHKKLIQRKDFEPEDVGNLNISEIELLRGCGHWLSGLATGAISPYTPKQEHFVQVHNGASIAETRFELVWMKYQESLKTNNRELRSLCIGCRRTIEHSRLKVGETLCRECAARTVEIAAEPKGEKCPRCGGTLIDRVRQRKGTSKYFIGCSEYPLCRYTEG